MTSVFDEYKVPRLNGGNWFAWSARAKAALVFRKVWKAIEPGYVDAQGNDLEVLTENQEDDNLKALSFLMLIVGDEFLADVSSCCRARAAWKMLERRHTQFSVMHTVQLAIEYVTYKKKDDMTMHQYLAAKHELYRKVQAGGIDFSDKQQAAFYLTGVLGTKYDDMVRSLESATDPNIMNSDNIKAKLVLEEMRLKREEEANGERSEVKALAVKPKKTKQYQDQGETRRSHDGSKNNRKHKSENPPRNIICFSCNQEGHIARNCPRFTNAQQSNDSQQSSDKNEASSKCEQKKGSAAVIKSRVLRTVQAQCKSSAAMQKKSDKTIWFLDTGATHHMTPHREFFSSFEEATGSVAQADDTILQVKGYGKVSVQFHDEYGGWLLTFSEVLYVPGLADNLMSGRQLDIKGIKLEIFNGICTGYDGRDEIFKAVADTGRSEMYVLEGSVKETVHGKLKITKVDNGLWHQRFGHMTRIPSLDIITHKTCDKCDVCLQGKLKRRPFPLSESRAKGKLDLIHSDVCQLPQKSIGGCRYFVTFVDDFSRYVTAVPIQHKSEVFKEFKAYQRRVELMHERKIKALQSDGGKEYCNNAFNNYFEETGIRHRVSIPYTPQQNGRSERVNQTLMNIVRCLLLQSGLPSKFWAEALKTACYIKNLCPSTVINDAIPYELWNEGQLTEEDCKRLKVFGCQAWYANLNKPKLGQRGKKAVFIGYEEDMKGYRLWDEEESKVVISRDVIFEEKIFPFKEINHHEEEQEPEDMINILLSVEESEENGNIDQCDGPRQEENEDWQDAQNDIVEDEENINEHEEHRMRENEEEEAEAGLRRSKRNRKKKECGSCHTVSCILQDEPKNVEEALSRPDSDKWREAMEKEIESMKKNKCWRIVRRPQNKNVIGSKWVFKLKKNEDGKIERHKARLVAQGYGQIPGTDYNETYSPVVRKESIRLMIAVSVEKGWQQEHWDVTTAYLHSPLQDEVYMEQPEFFEEKHADEYVCLLTKSLYGLHQAGRDWNQHLDSHLKSYGLVQSVSDPCIYYDPEGDLVVGTYVDDIPVWGKQEKINALRNYMEKRMSIKSLGKISHLLSMRVNRPEDDTVTLDQRSYSVDLLKEFRMDQCRGLSTPLEIKPEDDESSCKTPFPEKIYRRATGSLLYLANNTRPDLSHPVSRQCQHNNNPTVANWKGVQHILRYLQNTEDYCLTYKKQGKPIEVFVDSDWAGDAEGRKSYSGLVIKLAGGAVMWVSRKQGSVALSTVEAEYISLADGLKEVLWVKGILAELGLDEFVGQPCSVNIDNQGAMSLAKNKGTSKRSKHIDVRHHFVRELVERGEIDLKYVKSSDNVADILTKPLNGPKTKLLAEQLGLNSVQF